jgi:hypothetical protein
MRPLHRVASLLFLTLFAGVAAVRADDPQFKVGDRVEVDINMNREAADGNWKAGVIREVDLSARAYRVEIDGRRPGPDNWATIPIRTDKWTRASKAAAPAPVAAGRSSGVSPTSGTTAQGKPVDKAAATAIKGHAGPHEGTVEHIKAMIIADITFKELLEWDHVQVTFASLTTGQPYVEKAKNQSEINSLAYSRRYGVPVTPVKTKFSVLVRSNSGIEHLYEYDRTALWYINTRGECSLSKTGKAIDWVKVR